LWNLGKTSIKRLFKRLLRELILLEKKFEIVEKNNESTGWFLFVENFFEKISFCLVFPSFSPRLF